LSKYDIFTLISRITTANLAHEFSAKKYLNFAKKSILKST